MIGRLLTRIVDRIAERLMDRDWLHDMWFREQISRREVRNWQDDERPPASDQWPSRERGAR